MAHLIQSHQSLIWAAYFLIALIVDRTSDRRANRIDLEGDDQ
jgi:hypothetical protein